MSDLSSRAVKLGTDIAEQMSDLQGISKRIEAHLQEVLKTNEFALANLQHTERGVALAMGAYLDTVCRDCITMWIVSDSALSKDAFGERGFLGSLADKIQFMYAVGVYSRQVYDLLLSVARIRNRFAHDFEITNFSHPRVKGLVENLKPDEILILFPGMDKPAKISDYAPEPLGDAFTTSAKPEERFVSSVRFLAFLIEFSSSKIASSGQLAPRNPIFGV